MLQDYNNTVNSLNDIDRILLQEQIRKLNKALEPGYDSQNLSSLGIPDFIDNCNKAINAFKDVKNKVFKLSQMIEDILKQIEETVILRKYEFNNNNQLP